MTLFFIMTTSNIDVNDILKKIHKVSSLQRPNINDSDADVRTDNDQSQKFQEIVDLLVAAGYFRARIKGLSEFDKVVGGMTWCIDSCQVDLDVDILYQENSTIGQKIALTEKLVAVLPIMNCPHVIEPHQIQGLDFIHIFPVIQWLVKKSVEYRQEIAASVRSYAISQYCKEFGMNTDLLNQQRNTLKHINTIREKYYLDNQQKKSIRAFGNNSVPVQITLLDYDDNRKEQLQHITENAFQKLQSILNEENASYEHITEEDVKRIQEHFISLHMDLNESNKVSAERVQLLSIKKHIDSVLLCHNNLEKEKSFNMDTLQDLKNSLEELNLKLKTSKMSLEKMCNSEDEHYINTSEVEQIVIQNDMLKQQEINFRQHCESRLEYFENLISEANREQQRIESTPEPTDEIHKIEEDIKQLKLKLAKKNRKIALLQRQLDDVPNRPELTQYQRRFLELYNQVSAKHKETKQYYTLYNTLQDTLEYMKKELSLINSVSENYPSAMLSSTSKQEFLSQLQNIVTGIQQSKSKLDNKHFEERQKRDQLSSQLHLLNEQQRKYVAAVKELSIECAKYDTALSEEHN